MSELQSIAHDARTTALFAESMRRSSETLRDAILGEITAPVPLVWGRDYRQFQTAATWASGDLALEERRAGLLQAKYDLAESLRTRRDPCPVCGARGDYACGHGGGR